MEGDAHGAAGPLDPTRQHAALDQPPPWVELLLPGVPQVGRTGLVAQVGERPGLPAHDARPAMDGRRRLRVGIGAAGTVRVARGDDGDEGGVDLVHPVGVAQPPRSPGIGARDPVPDDEPLLPRARQHRHLPVRRSQTPSPEREAGTGRALEPGAGVPLSCPVRPACRAGPARPKEGGGSRW